VREAFVPRGPSNGPIHEQLEGLDLCVTPFIAEDYWNAGGVAAGPGTQFARRLQSQVAIDDFSVVARKHRNLEPELADAAAPAIDGSIVLSTVTSVEDQTVE
jgi:hypothetical protein